MTENTYEARLASWQKAKFAPPPEPELTPTSATLIDKVPMRDGIKLYTEIFLPDSEDSFPVVLLRSPYPYSCPSRNDRRPISRYLERGYGVVFQLTRGQGKSEGIFRRYFHEVNDGYDCIEWIANQDWCNGNVGMEGSSYLGTTQLLAARGKPAALKCIMPTAFVGNSIKYFPYAGGVAPRGVFMQWNKMADATSLEELDVAFGDVNLLRHPIWGTALRKRPLIDAADEVLSGDKLACWKEMVSHPFDNEFWRPVHFTDQDLAALDIPVFFTDGWYDMTIGPIDFFIRLERLQPGQSDRYLLIGPWNHYQTYSAHRHHEVNGERQVPEDSAVDLIAQRLNFYDRYLKGNNNAVIQMDRVQVYITGINKWMTFPTFPAPGTKERKLYLHSAGDARSFPGDGTLNWQVPEEEPPDSYVYDPNIPTMSEAEPLRDRREIEVRADVLTYTTVPFDEPLTILGEITLVLHAASDALDTDWFAVVTEVFPDGRSVAFHYSISALRARYRKGFDEEVLLTPGKSEFFTIPMGAAGHQLASGNRLRLSIFSAAFPKFDPNTNTGNSVATDTEMRIATQTVFHDASKPSHLIIPLIDSNELS